MTQDSLGDLWGHALSRQIRTERRPHRVEVEHAPLLVAGDDPFAGFAVRADVFLDSRKTGAEKVLVSGAVGHRPGEDQVLRGRVARLVFRELLGELRVERQHVVALRLSFRDAKATVFEVYVFPTQSLQVAFAKPGKRRSHVPGFSPTRLGDLEEPRELLVRERSAHETAVGPLITQGDPSQ